MVSSHRKKKTPSVRISTAEPSRPGPVLPAMSKTISLSLYLQRTAVKTPLNRYCKCDYFPCLWSGDMTWNKQVKREMA